MFQTGKKIAFCLGIWMLLMFIIAMPVYAEETEISYGTEAEVIIPDVKGWVSPPAVTAETAVVMEMTSAVCQYNKGRNEKRNPGALTKYMVMLLAAENCEPGEEIKFSKSVVQAAQADFYETIGVKTGEILTLEDCLYAVSIDSAADVMIGLAVHIAGSTDEFIEMMNARAKELGCEETLFSCLTGIENDKSYSSAYNMALIARAGLRNEILRTIMKKTSYTIPETNKSKARTLTCEEKIMLAEEPEYYEGCRAVSLFYEEQGGYNMFAAAKRDEITYIVVTFGNEDPEESYVDSKALLDYAHNNFVKSEFMIGTIVLPKMVSVDEINVNGTSDKETVNQRYYVDGWLVGKGSQNVDPPKNSEGIFPALIPSKDPEQENEEIQGTVEEMDDDEMIDMIEAEQKLEYFTVFGLSLKQWNFIGIIIIALWLILYLLVFIIVRNAKRNKMIMQRERERRIARYEEE